MSNLYKIDENIMDEDRINTILTPAYVIIAFGFFAFVLGLVLLIVSIVFYVKEKRRLQE